MKKLTLFIFLAFLAFACGNEKSDNNANKTNEPTAKKVDDGKGVGPVTAVELNAPLMASMVTSGKGVYELKCASCHRLTDKRVVGPGWKGLTKKRKPEWIMNMTMNVEEMLKEDETAKELLKECLVRMPNQNLSEEDARNVLEFMFSIDGQPVAEN